MCDFHVGQEVVAVGPPPGMPPIHPAVVRINRPKIGRHYTIRAIRSIDDGAIGILLNEVVNTPQMTTRGVLEIAWFPECFRPIKPDSIAIFRAMCVSPKPLVPVE